MEEPMISPPTDLLARCQELSMQGEVRIEDIVACLHSGGIPATVLDGLLQPDPHRPYGRRVLIQSDHLEVMLATWTPGVQCAPHTHGTSIGGVLVVRGTARHRVFVANDAGIEVAVEEQVGSGRVLVCRRGLLHSMGDGGGEEPLVTLHLYTDPIDHMVVYDLEGDRTLVVDGGCGAWIPEDKPHLIRSIQDGIVPPRTAVA